MHGQPGSDARMAILLYLAKRPVGARRSTLAELVGLDDQTTLHVLTLLRQEKRVASDRRGQWSLWYVPHARAQVDPRKLENMIETSLRGAP